MAKITKPYKAGRNDAKHSEDAEGVMLTVAKNIDGGFQICIVYTAPPEYRSGVKRQYIFLSEEELRRLSIQCVEQIHKK